MDLSPKAVRFVIEALEHQITEHERRLATNGLSDDEAADLANDKRYLEAIVKDFEKYRDELVHSAAR
jgi:hypothetical protein